METPPGVRELEGQRRARSPRAPRAAATSSRGGGFHDCRELQGGSELHALAEEAGEGVGREKEMEWEREGVNVEDNNFRGFFYIYSCHVASYQGVWT